MSRKFVNTRSTKALRDYFALPERPPTSATLAFACPEILRCLRREYFCTFFRGLEEENWRMGEEVGREGEGRLLLGPVTPTIQYGFPIPTNPYLYNDNESLRRVAQWIQFLKENLTSHYIWPAHMILLF